MLSLVEISELEIAKAGVLDGAKIGWADKLNIPESSISDQTALQGIIFLNEDFTIGRIKLLIINLLKK